MVERSNWPQLSLVSSLLKDFPCIFMFFLFWADNCFRDDSNIVGGKDPKNANLGDA